PPLLSAGTVRPKPPVRPKPRVLPKPAVPTKPPVLPLAPGPRHPRPELPSAEKMNRLAGPQPYSGGGTGGPLRRPSFTVKSLETPNGKGLPSPPVAAAEEEVPPTPPTPSRKGPAPFKVTPVMVGTRPERFPGTTVEEILAKMDSREGPGSPDRAWLSPFCSDPSSRFGSKTFTAFRRRACGEMDGDPTGEGPQILQPTAGELGMGDDGHLVAETRAGPAGSLPVPLPPLHSLRLGALGPPGSPRPPICPALAPGAPFQPAEPSAPAPGSPDTHSELLSPDSSPLPPGSPEFPAQPPTEAPAPSIQAPGAPLATKPHLGTFRSPGSPHTPGEGSPDTTSPPGTPKLPPQVSCPPGSPEAVAEYLGPPSSPLGKASCPPGSPEGHDDSAVSPQSHEGPDFRPPPRDAGLRRSSEGVLQSPPTGQGLGELGGSLSALPRPGDPLSEPSLGSESGWSLSQSFEWTFPSRGARLPAFPPRSPIQETPDSGLSDEGESDGEAAAPSLTEDHRSEGPDSQKEEGASCPGGPVAPQEAESSVEEVEEVEAEQDAPVSHSPLCVMEPGRDPTEPEPPTQLSITTAAPLDPASPHPAPRADLAWVGDGPKGQQGPGGPGQDEGPPQGPDPHADPGWLTELLASPGAHTTGHGSPENLLGWSRKDLCSEFGIGRPRQASCQDPDFGASTAKWGPGYGLGHAGSAEELSSGQADWGSGLSTGHSQELDKEPHSGQPTWVGRYSTSDTEMKDREPTSDWASKYSSRDAGSKGEDFTLGWAGRSSTGDTGSPDKELSPSRPAWDSRYSTRDMESQDREFSPSRPAWTGEYRDTESQDREFSPSRLAESGKCSTGNVETQDCEFCSSGASWNNRYSTQDMENQDREFSPSRPAWTGEIGDMESQDREFSPSRPAWTGEIGETKNKEQEFSSSRLTWDDKSSTRDMESQDREFSPSRLPEASECTTGDLETQDEEFSTSRAAWGDRSSTSDMEIQDSGFTPSKTAWDDGYSTEDMETRNGELFSPSWLSLSGEGSIGQTGLVGVSQEDMPGSCHPDPLAQEPNWSSAHQQQHGSSGSMDWVDELGGGDNCHNQFGSIGTEQVQDPCSARASDGSMSGGLQSLAGWHRDLSLDTNDARWSQDLDSWSMELQDAEAKRREWASAFGARCAARNRDLSTEEQSLEEHTNTQDSGREGAASRGGQRGFGAWAGLMLSETEATQGSCLPSRSLCLSTPSPPMGDVMADPPTVEPPQGELPCSTEEERDPPEPAAAPQSPGAPLLQLEAASRIPVDTGMEEPASDYPDGDRPQSWEEQPFSLGSPQPEGPVEQELEFPFLEDTELLDSSVFRTKASLGRKRRHRAPALRPAATEGDSWIFRDSTEPRPAPAVSSDEETVEEPRSRRMRGSPSGRGVKVPLFPGLSASAIKAKLRGRNRSAEEGASSGDSKGTPHKDHHVQRSKSCKIPGVSGKPPALPPKPEKSAASEASSPHWLQALKLKRKK
ncbi:TB182 protein, partial [Sakesphorus luctuosus]|nr:TB182 protein [Sakesphorus luctuosus]